MKKLISLLLSVCLLPVWLISCSSSPASVPITGALNDSVDGSVLKAGVDYFSEIKLENGMSEHAFRQWLGKITYRGDALTVLKSPSYFNNTKGKGIEGNHADFNYSHLTRSGSVSYSLTIRTPLGGFSLPWRIEIGDTLTAVYDKIGLGIDPLTDYVADEEASQHMTLLTSDEAVLALTDLTKAESNVGYLYPYELKLTCTDEYERPDGKDITAVTVCSMKFDEECKLVEAFVRHQEAER